MPSRRAERTLVVSGSTGYIQLLPEEKKAFRIEVYFTATNVGNTNYYNFEWYKERSLYGRFKVSRGEYTSKEKLVQYQNELLHSEEAALFEIVKRLQCGLQKQYEVNKFLVGATIQIAAALNVVTGFGGGSTAFDQIPPQPISIPGLQMDGLYYDMFPGCAGNIIFQTWYDDDICKDVNNQDLTRDNRGKAPDPAFPGRPPSGGESNVPTPTTAPGSSYVDPAPGTDEPTDTLDNPPSISGFPNTLYTVKWRDAFTRTGVIRGEPTITIVGQYSGLIRREILGGTSVEWGLNTSIGVPGVTQPIFRSLGESGVEPDGSTTVTITLLSITPQ